MKTLNKNLPYPKSAYIGFSVILFISILYLFAELANNKLSTIDFKVYYFAAKNILGGQSLYGSFVDSAHYIFKYSPSSALFFIPFTVFPFEIAKYVYWFFLTGMIIYGFFLCLRIIDRNILMDGKKTNKIILLATLVLVLHFTRELHLGQVNHILLVMYVAALWNLLNGKTIPFSILIAMSIFLKPFGLIFLPYLIYKRYYKAFFWVLGSALIIGILPIFFWGSWEMLIQQYGFWKHELIVEMSHKQELIMPENHTIFSVLARYTPLRWIISGAMITMVYQLIVLSGIALAVIYFIRLAKETKINPIIAEYGILVAIIPLLAFTTANAFGFAQILVFLILINFKSLNRTGKVLSIISFVFIGGACSDIIGKKASFLMDDLSLVSIGATILIVLIFGLRKRQIV